MRHRFDAYAVALLVLLVTFAVMGIADVKQTYHPILGVSTPYSLPVSLVAPREQPPHASRYLVRPSVPPKPVRPPAPRKPAPVSHHSGHNWDAVAKCESGGHWNHHTPTVGLYWGGLQMTLRGWVSYHGDRFAPRPDLATKAQQIQIAEHWLRAQGVGAWPTCGRYL